MPTRRVAREPARPAKVKVGKKKRRAKRTRPGEIDPQAAPRVGSSPYPGLPYPLGATPYENGTNFAVVADGVPGVTDVQLCLIDRGRHASAGSPWTRRPTGSGTPSCPT